MVIAGIAGLFNTSGGFGDNAEVALRVYEAIRASSCSSEVKSEADDVARHYDLIEEPQHH